MTENSQRDEGAKEAHHDEAEKHPPLAWTALSPGQAVGLRIYDTEHYVGTVESKTVDGLVIWLRDELNERRLFHYRDCEIINELPVSPNVGA